MIAVLKKIVVTIILSHSITNLVADNSTDSSRYKVLGIIPYEIFSRSSGIYFQYHLNSVDIELNTTYTIPTKQIVLGYYAGLGKDWFYFQGINNYFTIYNDIANGNKLGFILGFKYWWYSLQRISNEEGTLGSSYSIPTDLKSSKMYGPVFGFSYKKTFARRKWELSFFSNLSVSLYTLITDIKAGHSNTGASILKESIVWPNVAIGIKFGYKFYK